MSLLDKATIIITPTAHSNGKLHSIKGGAVADFDVVRNSVATRVASNGLIESVATDIPRIDYTTGEGVILTEPQSTNLITNSSLFVAVSGGSVTNNEVSPDGTTNAIKINFGTGVNSGALIGVSGSSATPSTEYTLSFYAKNFSGDGTFNLRLDTDTQANLVNQGFTATSEWARYTHTLTTDASATSFGSGSRFRKSTDNNDVLIWGAQLEELPYSTSYIPTSGAIATRLADKVSGAGDATTFNDSEGVLYAEIAALSSDNVNRFITISDGSTSNRVALRFDTTNKIGGFVTDGTSQASFRYEINTSNFSRVAIKYKLNDFALWVNGFEVLTDFVGSTPSGLNVIDFKNAVGGDDFYGKTKTIAVFSEALTDEELTCLTTI